MLTARLYDGKAEEQARRLTVSDTEAFYSQDALAARARQAKADVWRWR
jgi:hypothetical protein